MNEKEYNKLLEKAFKELPEKITKKERFQMPKVNSFIQGSKTIIKEFAKLIKDLQRDPKDAAKFIANELATASYFSGDNLMLKGKFSSIEIQKIIEQYIKEFILCKECNRPDTKISEQSGIKILKCEACGAVMPLKIKY